jgi:DNA-directed RNA polymerase subunit M/transcription elongation factor TFIIS
MDLVYVRSRDPYLYELLQDQPESAISSEYMWLVLERLVYNPDTTENQIQKEDRAQYLTKEAEYIQDCVSEVMSSNPLISTPEDIFQGNLEVGVQCVKCHGKNVRYVLRAKRSGDEAMLAVCTCRDCHHKFTLTV